MLAAPRSTRQDTTIAVPTSQSFFSCPIPSTAPLCPLQEYSISSSALPAEAHTRLTSYQSKHIPLVRRQNGSQVLRGWKLQNVPLSLPMPLSCLSSRALTTDLTLLFRNGTISSIKEIVHNLSTAKLGVFGLHSPFRTLFVTFPPDSTDLLQPRHFLTLICLI